MRAGLQLSGLFCVCVVRCVSVCLCCLVSVKVKMMMKVADAQNGGLLLSRQSPLLQARPSLPYPSIVTTE